MTKLTCHHPILGELLRTGSSQYGRLFTGSALLTPKHPVRVSVHVPSGSDEYATLQVVEDSAKFFSRLCRSEWEYRLALANGLLGDLAGSALLGMPRNAEGVARLISLADINFIEVAGVAVMAYRDRTANPALPPHSMYVNVIRADSTFSISLYPQG